MFDTEEPLTSELRFAFDLSVDPHELNNLAGEAWAQHLREEVLPLLEPLARRSFEPGAVPLGARERAGLEALGYTGDEDP
jgi:hypothetical protein